jgi:RNA polymerase sigma-70 factor (ECF subfamily)
LNLASFCPLFLLAEAFYFMQEKELIPYLYRTEFRKITTVLCRLFGIEHITIAEDIVGDTFLLAAETWGLKGIPANPAAWLYIVAKNKTRDFLKRNTIFKEKVSPQVQ